MIDSNISEQLSEMQNRLNALEAENSELIAQLDLWKPKRVQVTQPADNRKPGDFARPQSVIKQFSINEAAAMPESELLRAIERHMSEQLPNLSGANEGLIRNLKALYPVGTAKALKGKFKQAKIEGYRGFAHALILQQFGFTTFVSDAELKASIF